MDAYLRAFDDCSFLVHYNHGPAETGSAQIAPERRTRCIWRGRKVNEHDPITRDRFAFCTSTTWHADSFGVAIEKPKV